MAIVKKATYESGKKRTVGVDDLCLLSKISNEAINDNLKVRFENREIYVCCASLCMDATDRPRPISDMC